MKTGLKSRVLRLGGVHHGVWWAPIFVFFDAADRMAIRDKIVLTGKSILSRKSRGFPCLYEVSLVCLKNLQLFSSNKLILRPKRLIIGRKRITLDEGR